MQLTQLIYDREVIWNRSHPDHSVLLKRDEACDEVARELGMLGWATDRKFFVLGKKESPKDQLRDKILKLIDKVAIKITNMRML
ncbi:hypothetical protein quinque_013072 [Culex quinquefasciatus]